MICPERRSFPENLKTDRKNKMAGIQILGTGLSVPGKILSNDDLSRMLDTSDEWIVKRTGIRRRHITDGGEAVHTLAVNAAGKAVMNAEASDSDFTRDKLSAVITATMTSDYVCPSVSCILQKELGLPQATESFDISAACTGFVFALHTAFCILNERKGGYALVTGSECMSRIMDYTDRACCVLFGDGAGAAVIRYDASDNAIFHFIAGTEGNTDDLYCSRGKGQDGFLHMNGGKVYRFASVSLKKAIERLLDECHITMDDVDMMVCHQANARIIESVRKNFPGHEHKFYMNMEEYANTSSASVALAMADMFEKGLLHSGMRVITAAFGAGLSWNAALMTL